MKYVDFFLEQPSFYEYLLFLDNMYAPEASLDSPSSSSGAEPPWTMVW